MSATIIDGKAYAQGLRARIAGAVGDLSGPGVTPGLAVVIVGEDPASQLYVRNKARQTVEAGMRSFEHKLPASTSEAELLGLVAALSADPAVDGILVQLPLPKQIDARAVIDAISPAKDVDGFHPISVGMLHLGRPALVPCTPSGVIRLIESTGEAIAGKHAVVIGRSDIVGKPMALLLLAADATVTVCHSRTTDLGDETKRADVLVAAARRANLVTADMVKERAAVVDVGMTRPGGGLRGDVDPAVAERAALLTPVPGGVGPMTIASLLRNTVQAARLRSG